MKKECVLILGVMILSGFGVFSSEAQAAEYQCTVSSTRAEGCEAYFDEKEVCLFPEELNIQRTKEAETSSFTYPQFCSETCAQASGIPAKCRKGAITEIVSTSKVVEEEKLDIWEFRGGITERDVYTKADTFMGKAWNWLRKFWRSESFQARPMSTPVAGVRG